MVRQGRELARQGDIEGAIAAYATAQMFDPTLEIYARQWNNLCWFGSLWGYAADVPDACDRAVALQPDNGAIYDGRGIARASTGDYAGAIEDLQYFVDWSKENDLHGEYIVKREAWIIALEAGRNPFDEATLEALKNE